MHRANLIGYEQGRTRPQLDSLLRLAEALERPAEWFVDPEVDPSPFPDNEAA